METNLNRVYKTIKVAVIAAFILILIFLIQQKHIFSREVVYNYDFGGQTKFIQGLYPEGRIVQLVESQQVNLEPVYFEVYAPQKYAKAKVKLRYKNAAGLGVKLGLKLDLNDWSFFMADLPSGGAEFVESEVEFDLEKAYKKNNRLKFIIASPAVNESQEKIFIDNVVVILIK